MLAYFLQHNDFYTFFHHSVDKVIDPDWRKVFPVLIFDKGFVWWKLCGKFSRYSEINAINSNSIYGNKLSTWSLYVTSIKVYVIFNIH